MGKIKETSSNFVNKQALEDECAVVYASNIIGRQWSLAICCYLLRGKMRFGELRKCLPNITERMLTIQLRKLEENKVVKRTVFAQVPPKVEYELTPMGFKLHNIIMGLKEWGNEHKLHTKSNTSIEKTVNRT
nr:helix-turn-helix domain-containing protein [uncultured Flavobacterium sp.]